MSSTRPQPLPRTIRRRLCDLPAAPQETCCGTPTPPPTTPLDITNAPGLSSIAYRIGTFGAFRRAMLDRLGRSESSSGDYQTMFVELWAYLADVLTFYQERIANEAYLQTATQLSSLLRLAQLIGYRPQPGSAASGVVAFTVEKGKTITIPKSFRVSTRAGGGKPAVVFETSEAIEATGSRSRIPIAKTVKFEQFAPMRAYESLSPHANQAEVSRDFQTIFGGVGWMFLDLFPVLRALRNPAQKRTVVFAGTKNRIAAGDWLLVVDSARTPVREVCRVMEVTPDDEEDTTAVVWEESGDRAVSGYVAPVSVFAFRVVATPFGSNAPMSPVTVPVTSPPSSPAPPKPWDDDHNRASLVPANDEAKRHLSLDSVYDSIDASPATPGWVLLQKGDEPPRAFSIDAAKTTGRAEYEISGKVTRLQFREDVEPEYPLRSTTVYAANELLTVQERLPVTKTISGRKLILDGVYSDLSAGHVIVFEGTLAGTTERATEQVTIAETPAIDTASALTTIVVNPPIAAAYDVANAIVYANVVAVTQGETVRKEILGSGDGGAYQTFALKKSPLTYLPSTVAEGLSAVESTLAVTVNNVLWKETTTLLERAHAREYMTAVDDTSVTSVVFGDGVNGATPPTGKDNILATYRKGIGTTGNVAAGAIQVLLDNVAGLQKVTNPLVTSGAADAETVVQIRVTAPKSVRTFSRAVSVDDYAALALTYPGVAKASASRVTTDAATGAALARPYIRLTIAASGGTALRDLPSYAAALRAYLDKRRDPNVALRIVDYTAVYVDLSATIDFRDDYPREATLASAASAALGYFSFDRLAFGQSLRLSAVYAMLQTVTGVRSATITRFRATNDLATTADDVPIRSTELAVLKNDAADATKGTLVLTPGTGGYADR